MCMGSQLELIMWKVREIFANKIASPYNLFMFSIFTASLNEIHVIKLSLQIYLIRNIKATESILYYTNIKIFTGYMFIIKCTFC